MYERKQNIIENVKLNLFLNRFMNAVVLMVCVWAKMSHVLVPVNSFAQYRRRMTLILFHALFSTDVYFQPVVHFYE